MDPTSKATLPFIRFNGLVYRAHHPAWAFDPESGEGAKIHGGRFNRAGIACFYAALNLETAWLEAQQGFAFKAQPLTICSYRAELSDVLDLTNPDVREAADVTLTQLGCAWEQLSGDRKPVPTWELANRLIASGCAGVIVPGFARALPPTIGTWCCGHGVAIRRIAFRSLTMSSTCLVISRRGRNTQN